MNLAIAMLLAYLPFFIWMYTEFIKNLRMDKTKRSRRYKQNHYWGEE